MKLRKGDVIVWMNGGTRHTSNVLEVDEKGFTHQWDVWDWPSYTSWDVWEVWQHDHGMKIDETIEVQRILKEYE
jgi:hypothetical protein